MILHISLIHLLLASTGNQTFSCCCICPSPLPNTSSPHLRISSHLFVYVCLLHCFLQCFCVCVGGSVGCYPSHPKWPCILIILCSQALQSKLWDGGAEMTKRCLISRWFLLRMKHTRTLLVHPNAVNIITRVGWVKPFKVVLKNGCRVSHDVNNSEHLATHLLVSLRSDSFGIPCTFPPLWPTKTKGRVWLYLKYSSLFK